jgi:hypothetical protein
MLTRIPDPPHHFRYAPTDGFKRSILDHHGVLARGTSVKPALVDEALRRLGYTWGDEIKTPKARER